MASGRCGSSFAAKDHVLIAVEGFRPAEMCDFSGNFFVRYARSSLLRSIRVIGFRVDRESLFLYTVDLFFVEFAGNFLIFRSSYNIFLLSFCLERTTLCDR